MVVLEMDCVAVAVMVMIVTADVAVVEVILMVVF